MKEEKNTVTPSKRLKKENSETPCSPESESGPSLMWFRNDLRISDNPALYNAYIRAGGRGVVAVYIIAEKEWHAHELAPCKVDLILRTLNSLQRELWDNFSIPLYIRRSSFLPRVFGSCAADKLPEKDNLDISSRDAALTPQVLLQLCRETGATSVFFNKEYEIDEALRDKHVTDYLNKHGISICSFHDQCVAPPGSILTKEQKPYTVFTPFRSSWYKYIDANPQSIKLTPLPGKNAKSYSADDEKIPEFISGFEMNDENYAKTIRDMWPAGHANAKKLLDEFAAKRIAKYKDSRDFPATKGTSALSPYLSIGALSVRECIMAAITPSGSDKPNPKLITGGNQGVVTWISELCWRDFYRHVLFFFPRVSKNKPFKLTSDYVKWRSDPEQFKRWTEGKTGYPIVDAGMRQLNATGYMHNRVRMITAMFLTKDLLIDWRLGESYFMKHLIDGDFASNNGGWQWSASTGTDAQPYFRVFNPALQSEKNDPAGEYIKKWIPELASVDAKSIHEPHAKLPFAQFNKTGYPKPIVEHDFARKRAIEAFKTAFAKDK